MEVLYPSLLLSSHPAAIQPRMPRANEYVDSVAFLDDTRMVSASKNGALDRRDREQSAIGKYLPFI